MRVRVLGSAAGGGVPQWNCACENCALARRGDPRVARRTQDSLLVSRGDRHLLVNASPDVARQIEATPELWPRAPRGTAISAIVLTNGDLDHVLGLFTLREWQRLVVYATASVWSTIAESSFVRTLARFDGQLTHRRLEIGRRCAVDELGIWLTPYAAPGKLPVHASGRQLPSDEDNVALRLEGDAKAVAIATAASDARAVVCAIERADVAFLDGTFYASDELESQCLGHARAEEMAHHPLGGERGSLALLRNVECRRKILTHVNNTNPILRADSPERAEVLAMGFEVAHDGMEADL